MLFRSYLVYMHISPSNKRYIGITCQKPKKRWGKNGKGYERQEYFYRAIEKYGWDNFQHIIIAKGLTKEIAEWLENNKDRVWSFVILDDEKSQLSKFEKDRLVYTRSSKFTRVAGLKHKHIRQAIKILNTEI